MSVRKNNEGNKISKDDAMYLVQDAKQELFRSNQDLSIIHMIVENYVLDDVKHIFLPLGKKCTKYSKNYTRKRKY